MISPAFRAKRPMLLDTSDPSLVLYLPLWYPRGDMTGSTIYSYDRNRHTGTVTGATFGLQGRTFDGIDDVINLGNIASLKPTAAISVLVWLKPTTLAAAWIDEIISCEGAAFTGYGLRFSSKVTSFYIEDGISAPEAQGSTWVAGNTIFLCGTYDGTNLLLYENGVSVGAGGTGGNPIAHNAGNLQIGKNPSDATRILTGLVGEVIIFNRALSASEIRNLYFQTKWRYI